MRKAFVLILIILLCGFQHSNTRHRSAKIFNGGGGGGITAGDLLVCSTGVDSTNGNVSLTDTLNSVTLTVAVSPLNNAWGAPLVTEGGIHYFANSASGSSDVITATAPGTIGFGTVNCLFVKNIATSTPLDQVANGPLTTSTNATTNTVTTRSNGEFIYSFGVFDSGTITAGNGTLIDANSFISAPEYRIQTVGGAGTANTYTNASTAWGAILATFTSNGSIPAIDGTCHGQTQTITGGNKLVLTISC